MHTDDTRAGGGGEQGARCRRVWTTETTEQETVAEAQKDEMKVATAGMTGESQSHGRDASWRVGA